MCHLSVSAVRKQLESSVILSGPLSEICQLPQKAHRHTPPPRLNSKCRPLPFAAIHTTFRLSQRSLLMALCGFIEGLMISCQSVKNKVCSWTGPPKSLFSAGPYQHAQPIVKEIFKKSSRSEMIQLIVIKLAFELQCCWQRLASSATKKKKSIAESAASPLSAMTEDR